MSSANEDPAIEDATETLGRLLTRFPWRTGVGASSAANQAEQLLKIFRTQLAEPGGGGETLSNLEQLLGDLYRPD
jgi:hypothetical protein